ncbi:MAG TPA: hypothetical protein VE777_06220 [Gaiellales bacterium]|jgi:hypothetical protein|nr:hypothetical protein [Gaiellales bacterium]
MILDSQLSARPAPPLRGSGAHPQGHDHFWERAFTRGGLVRAGAVAAGAGLLSPAIARAGFDTGDLPRHIPGGIQPFGPGTQVFHVFLPGRGAEPATIYNFHGTFGVAALKGTGTGIDTATGRRHRLLWDVDLRFYKGKYIGRDRQLHHATFGFV